MSTRTTPIPTGRKVALESFWAILAADPGQAKPATSKRGVAAKKVSAKALALGKFVTRLDAATADRIIKRGISSRSLSPFGDYMGFGKVALARVLDLDRTTASRKVNSDAPLPRHAGETMLRLLDLTQMAEDTFSSIEDATDWLSRAHPMLDGETPIECAKTSFGAERVKSVLVALKYGGVV